MTHIAKNIKYLMKNHKMTQSDFGEIFGLRRAVVSSYVTETAVPKMETLLAICNHFGITLDDIVNKDLSKSAPKARSYYNDPLIQQLANEPSGSIEHGALQELLDSKDRIIELLENEIKRLKEERKEKNQSKTKAS